MRGRPSFDGHDVRFARNGQEGLARVTETLPDLLLCDVEMPVLNGPDMAYRMFVRDAGQEKIPIILSSGARDLHDIAARVGTPYFLAKPFSVESLRALMARALTEQTPPRPRV